MTHPIAYIRVIVIDTNAHGEARCLPVNDRDQAFDGAGFFPGYLMVHSDALVSSGIEQRAAQCGVYYEGKPMNRQAMQERRQQRTTRKGKETTR